MNRLDEASAGQNGYASVVNVETPSATANAHARGSVRHAWIIPNATVFISSFCIMVIELVAGRIIARHLGSSIYTWTSVIGVVLGGIAVGNYIGGRLADRFPARPTLSMLFILSSATSAFIVLINLQVAEWPALWALSWPARVASHVALVFLLPSTLLGTISPVAGKMALDACGSRGRTLGSVYAWGVVGSILGTFVTGFYLIAQFGTMTVVWSVAGILALVGLLYGAASIRAWGWAAVLAAGAALANGPWSWARTVGERIGIREAHDANVIYSDESQYSYIEVFRMSDSEDVRGLRLDKLLHSAVNIESPDELRYEYERIYAAATRRLAKGRGALRTLTIGGGGYVFPAYLNRNWPGSETEVVEIDPRVTRAAFQQMGLPPNGAIRVYDEDGRVVVDRLTAEKKRGAPVVPYDFIYLDAVNDYNVPYQLTSLEFMERVHGLLAPGGAFLMNLIDAYDRGRLLSAAYCTLRKVFTHVYIFTEGKNIETSPGLRSTFILVATDAPFDTQELGSEYSERSTVSSMTDAQIESLVARTGTLVLTDDYSPVENLVAAVVRDSSGPLAIDEWRRLAQRLIAAGKNEQAISLLKKALARNPSQVSLLLLLGNAELLVDRSDDAIQSLKKALALSETASAHTGLAAALTQQNRHEEALVHRRAAVALNPHDAQTVVLLGTTLVRLGRWDEAFATFAEAARLRPQRTETLATWAVALEAAGRIDDALAKYEEALRARPDFAEAHFNRANLLLNLKRYDAAVAAFREYLKLRPDDADAQFNIGNSLYLGNKLEEAAEAYLEAMKLNANYVNAYLNVALIRESQGRLLEAQFYCDQLVKARPDDQEARRLLGRIVDRQRTPSSGPTTAPRPTRSGASESSPR
jgi:tetratricopeptide (TPR) repeat protein/predicted membrane-bound spermidine synthase